LILVIANDGNRADSSKTGDTTTNMIMITMTSTIFAIHISPIRIARYQQTLKSFYLESFVANVPGKPFKGPNFVMNVARQLRQFRIVPVVAQNYHLMHCSAQSVDIKMDRNNYQKSEFFWGSVISQ
jgi:hypothetical protein